ncbi:MAG: hemerythrin [Anaerolinea sp.]|nr:hemerythrin [Anaerolinea sp.]
MAFLAWKAEYSVGNEKLDQQHQMLVELINKLHEAMKAGKAGKEIGLIVDEMVEYTKFHFGTEEKLMAEKNYIGLATQKNEHSTFIKKTVEFQNEVNSGKLAVSLDVLNFLKDWLTNHILISDMKYSGKI